MAQANSLWFQRSRFSKPPGQDARQQAGQSGMTSYMKSRVTSIRSRFPDKLIRWQAAVVIAFQLGCSFAQGAQASDNSAHSSSKTAGQLQSLGVARADSAFRYLAEKGAELFRSGRFAESEDFYRAALTNAEHDGVHDRRLAMLVTNLATDLRQQQKYEEAEPLFERAVELERKATVKDEALMIYTARQYAGLLRETARDASADAVMVSARNNFAIAPTNSRTFLSANAKDDSSTEHTNKSAPDGRETERETKARLYDLAHGLAPGESRPALGPGDGVVPGSGLTPYPVAVAIPMPLFVPLNSQSSAPPSRLDNGVAAELRMLADIERTYQDESAQQSQMLPSSFSYMNGGPLYSSFGGLYAGTGLSGYGGGYGGYGGYSGFSARSHRGGGSSGRGHHR